jgi:release factor glutamine methyltransferase
MPTEPVQTARPNADASQPWTTRRLLDWMTKAFRERELDSPRLLAELLLAHIAGCERLALYTPADRPASDDERERLRALVGRALKHEPVQYLVGEGWFFSLPFLVDPRVLVPRPATETIVEHVLQRIRHDGASLACGHDGEGLIIADVCTGSGCIAVSLLKNLPMARCVASDVSPDALDVARFNAKRHGVLDRLTLVEGNLLDPIAAARNEHAPDGFQFVLSNPPYIPDREWAEVETNVKGFEPTIALRGGTDGLDLVRPLLANTPGLLRSNGEMLIETAASTAQEASAIARSSGELKDVRVLKDFEGFERVIAATKR